MKKKRNNLTKLKFPILTILILILFLTGCKDPEIIVVEAPQEVEEPAPDPVVDPDPPYDPPEPPITQQPIEIALYDGLTLKGYDGIEWYDLLTGNVLHARNNFFVSDKSGNPVLYELDNMGATISEQNLSFFPSKILKANNSDSYACENIAPADAFAQNALHKDHVQIWKNGNIVGSWKDNQWKCTDIIEAISGDVFAVDSGGVNHGLNNSLAVSYVEHGGLIIHSLDVGIRRAIYKTDLNYIESFATNYAFNANAKTWQFDGLNWYNANGYQWSEAGGLLEQSTAMWYWNITGNYPVWGQAPVMLSVGTRFEVGENVLYWLECNTGWLYRYVPSVDRMDQAVRLYIGDGLKASGQSVKSYVDPYIIGDGVYFNYGGSLNMADLDTGAVSVFVGANVESWGW